MNIQTKTKKRKPGVKPKTLRQLMLEGFSKINKRLDNVEKRLNKHDQLFELVLNQFKKHKWIE